MVTPTGAESPWLRGFQGARHRPFGSSMGCMTACIRANWTAACRNRVVPSGLCARLVGCSGRRRYQPPAL